MEKEPPKPVEPTTSKPPPSSSKAPLPEAKKIRILNTIKEIIETEFIRRKFYACSLPATFIFYELATTYDCQVEPTCGTLLYTGTGTPMASNSHYWNEFQGVRYDPTLKMMKSLQSKVDINEFTYLKGTPNVRGEEDVRMLFYFHVFSDTRSADSYFEDAPSNLNELRGVIHKKVKKKINDLFKKGR